jgi:hypothetical protein
MTETSGAEQYPHENQPPHPDHQRINNRLVDP